MWGGPLSKVRGGPFVVQLWIPLALNLPHGQHHHGLQITNRNLQRGREGVGCKAIFPPAAGGRQSHPASLSCGCPRPVLTDVPGVCLHPSSGLCGSAPSQQQLGLLSSPPASMAASVPEVHLPNLRAEGFTNAEERQDP